MNTLGPWLLASSNPQLPWLLCGAVGGYLLVLFTCPIRTSLRDGFRSLRRYPMLWMALGGFGFAYALFRLGLRCYLHAALPPGEAPPLRWFREAWLDPQLWLSGSSESLWYLPPGTLHEVARESLLPAVESLAGIFNCLIPTFPLAAIAALLFIVNWDGHRRVLFEALRRRFGVGGWLVHAGLLLCALVALAKPLLYIFARSIDSEVCFRLLPVADWLAFLFEYQVGVCVQIYLILLAYCWVRGISFGHEHLLDVALRRFSFVMRWAAVVMLLGTFFINVPTILTYFDAFATWFPSEEKQFDARLRLASGLISGVLLLFATMQITLTFHSESLRDALRDHRAFLARNWSPLGWFFAIAGFNFYLTQALTQTVTRGLGEDTAAGAAWSLISPWLMGAVGGWLLASWVCIFKRCDTGGTRDEDWIKF